jgi:hypothetical protein
MRKDNKGNLGRSRQNCRRHLISRKILVHAHIQWRLEYPNTQVLMAKSRTHPHADHTRVLAMVLRMLKTRYIVDKSALYYRWSSKNDVLISDWISQRVLKHLLSNLHVEPPEFR